MKDEIKKIFICGPSDCSQNYYSRTVRAELKLTWKGNYWIFNPMAVLHAMPSSITRTTFAVIETAMFQECNAIYMLEGWKESPEAVVYHNYAKMEGYEVDYEEDEPEYSCLCGNRYIVEQKDKSGNTQFVAREREHEFKEEDHDAKGFLENRGAVYPSAYT